MYCKFNKAGLTDFQVFLFADSLKFPTTIRTSSSIMRENLAKSCSFTNDQLRALSAHYQRSTFCWNNWIDSILNRKKFSESCIRTVLWTSCVADPDLLFFIHLNPDPRSGICFSGSRIANPYFWEHTLVTNFFGKN